MTLDRDAIRNEILGLKGNHFLLELPTGLGKSRIAIEKIKSNCNKGKLLIVSSRLVHKENWAVEFKKWWRDCPMSIKFIAYASIHKVKLNEYDWVIFDEVHHLSERCRDIVASHSIKNSMLLSATVKRDLKKELRLLFKDLVEYKRSLRNVIDGGSLPDPMVYLVPLELDNTIQNQVILKNKNLKGAPIDCDWKDRWKHITQKVYPVRVHCTAFQYLLDMDSYIDFWKRKSRNGSITTFKNKWLKLCGDRLTWLSDYKVPYVEEILKKLKDKRTLTFCNNIGQTEKLGMYCINSKNKMSTDYLKAFNDKKINHITACTILNEGMNLVDCQIGIFNNLNSSDTIVIQRTGRILRHKNPIIILPYFKNTREEEMVKKMMENYNKELIQVVDNIDELNI